jgi:hypothetical protein
MEDISIVNNIILGYSSCRYIRWGNATNTVTTNSTVCCEGNTAINTKGMNVTNQTLSHNAISEGLSGIFHSNLGLVGRGVTSGVFASATGMDYWPAADSALRNNVDLAPNTAQGFSGSSRQTYIDVGAYEVNQYNSNSGWVLSEGFTSRAGSLSPPSAPIDLTVN